MVRSIAERNSVDVRSISSFVACPDLLFLFCFDSLTYFDQNSYFSMLDFLFFSTNLHTFNSLTALEAAEEAYMIRLNAIVTPETPPIVLGRSQHQNTIRQQQLRAQQQLQQQQQAAAAASQAGDHNSRSSSPRTLNRRSRSSTGTDDHTHDPADDGSTIVNPSSRNRQQQASSHEVAPSAQQAAMFWNRTRRSSAGGDR